MRRKLSHGGIDEPTSPGRRQFLGRSVAGGAGVAALFGHTTADASAEPQAGLDCGRPSFSDSLVVYLRFTSLLLTEALMGVISQCESELNQYSDAFKSLYDKVKLLETEMCKTRSAPGATRMRSLVETGLNSARTLRQAVFSTGREVEPVLLALTLVGDQVCTLANDLRREQNLTEQEVVYLQEILKAVNTPEYRQLREGVEAVRGTCMSTGSEATERVGQLETQMISARRNIITAEAPATPAAGRAAAWKAAEADLTAAINTLRSLLLLKLNNRRVIRSRLPLSLIESLPELPEEATVELNQWASQFQQAEQEYEKQSGEGGEVDAGDDRSLLWPADTLVFLLLGVRRGVRGAAGIAEAEPPREGAEGAMFVRTSAARGPAVPAAGEPLRQTCTATPGEPRLRAVGRLLDCFCPPGNRLEIAFCDALVQSIPYMPRRTWLTGPVRRGLIKTALVAVNTAASRGLTERLACNGRRNLTSLAAELEKLYA